MSGDPRRIAIERVFPADVLADLDRQRAEESQRRAILPAPSGEAAEPTTHAHRYERFSRVIEACCDSMHYFCDCGAKEPCADPSTHRDTPGGHP